MPKVVLDHGGGRDTSQVPSKTVICIVSTQAISLTVRSAVPLISCIPLMLITDTSSPQFLENRCGGKTGMPGSAIVRRETVQAGAEDQDATCSSMMPYAAQAAFCASTSQLNIPLCTVSAPVKSYAVDLHWQEQHGHHAAMWRRTVTVVAKSF